MRPAITVAALALVMAACGGGDDTQGVASLQDPDSTTTTTTGGARDEGDGSAVDSEQALLEFAECMREHGIDMEDPSISGEGGGFIRIGPPPGAGGDGSDNDFEAMEEAREACSEFLEGVTQQFGEIDPTEMQDQALEFAQCVRDQGFDVPDPDFSDIGPDVQSEEGGDGEVGGGPFGDIDPEDPAFQAALEECGDIFGGAFGPPTGDVVTDEEE
jgi:hypothetical protein